MDIQYQICTYGNGANRSWPTQGQSRDNQHCLVRLVTKCYQCIGFRYYIMLLEGPKERQTNKWTGRRTTWGLFEWRIITLCCLSKYCAVIVTFKSDRPKISPRGVQNEKIENPQTLPGYRSG